MYASQSPLGSSSSHALVRGPLQKPQVRRQLSQRKRVARGQRDLLVATHLAVGIALGCGDRASVAVSGHAAVCCFCSDGVASSWHPRWPLGDGTEDLTRTVRKASPARHGWLGISVSMASHAAYQLQSSNFLENETYWQRAQERHLVMQSCIVATRAHEPS